MTLTRLRRTIRDMTIAGMRPVAVARALRKTPRAIDNVLRILRAQGWLTVAWTEDGCEW